MYNFRLSLLEVFVQRGIDIVVVAPRDDYSDRFAAAGITFIATNKLKAQGKNPIADFMLYTELKEILNSVRPHLIFSYTIKPNIYGILAAKSLGIPAIAVITGLGYGISNGGLMKSVVERLYRFSLRNALKTWFLNEEDEAYFVQKKIVKRKNSRIIPGEGIAIDYFLRKSPYPDGKTTIFIYTGRLLFDKGVGDFVEAIRVLKSEGWDVKGELLGFTDTQNPSAVPLDTVSYWQQEGYIEYLGYTDDVRPFLERAHCMVFPSYYSEGIPRCLLEAASMEIPAITTDHVGCRDVVVDGQTGFLNKPKDTLSLIGRMKSFVNLSREERIEMGEKARHHVHEKYAEKLIHDIYIKQVAEILQL